MKGAKRDDVFINEVRPYFLAHFLLTGNLKTLWNVGYSAKASAPVRQARLWGHAHADLSIPTPTFRSIAI